MYSKAFNLAALAVLCIFAGFFPATAQTTTQYKKLTATTSNFADHLFGGNVAINNNIGVVLAAGERVSNTTIQAFSEGRLHFIVKDDDGQWNIIDNHIKDFGYEQWVFNAVGATASSEFVVTTHAIESGGLSSIPELLIFNVRQMGYVGEPRSRSLYSNPFQGYSKRLPVAMTEDYIIAGNHMDINKKLFIYGKNTGGTYNFGEMTTKTDGLSTLSYGYSVHIDGTTAIAGSPAIGNGTVHIFYRDQGGANTWGQLKTVVSSDGGADDRFGEEVFISGDILAVTSLNDDDRGSNAGAVYIYSRNQGGTNNWGIIKKITAADGAAGDAFGKKIWISNNVLIVGAPNDDDGGTDTGSIYFFAKDQGGTNNWGQVKKTGQATPAAGNQFGSVFGVYADEIMAGIPMDDANGSNSGLIDVRKQNTGGTNNWGLIKSMGLSTGLSYDRYGTYLSTDGDFAVVSTTNDEMDYSTGIEPWSARASGVYIYGKSEGGVNNWGLIKRIPVTDASFENVVMQGERFIARHSNSITVNFCCPPVVEEE